VGLLGMAAWEILGGPCPSLRARPKIEAKTHSMHSFANISKMRLLVGRAQLFFGILPVEVLATTCKKNKTTSE